MFFRFESTGIWVWVHALHTSGVSLRGEDFASLWGNYVGLVTNWHHLFWLRLLRILQIFCDFSGNKSRKTTRTSRNTNQKLRSVFGRTAYRAYRLHLDHLEPWGHGSAKLFVPGNLTLGQRQGLALSPIIMEVKNYPKWKETNIEGTHFPLPWLSEEE